MREQHRVAEPAADQGHGGVGVDFGRRAGGAHQHHRLARLQQRAEVGTAAHLQHDDADQAALGIGPGAGHRQAFHGQQGAPMPGSREPRRQHLEVLQPVELAGPEGAGGGGGVHHHLDDGRRQAVHRMHRAATGRRGSARSGRRRTLRVAGRRSERAGDDGIAALGAAHRLHHVAEEARVQVAEEADEAAVVGARCISTWACVRLGEAALRRRLDGRPRPPPGNSGRRAGCGDPRAPARCSAGCRRRPGWRGPAGLPPCRRRGAASARRRGRCSSVSTASGVRPSAKRTPSSSAFATSSWFSV